MKKKTHINDLKKVLTSEFKTKRVTANRLDKVLYKPFKGFGSWIRKGNRLHG